MRYITRYSFTDHIEIGQSIALIDISFVTVFLKIFYSLRIELGGFSRI